MPKSWKILKYAFICAVFCGTSGALLPAVRGLVEPRRVAYQQKQEAESLKTLVPGAEIIRKHTAADGRIYYAAYTAGDVLSGYVFRASARGYSSDIEMLCGLDKEFNITGFKVLSQAETPGLGAKITEPSFAAGLTGHPARRLHLRQDTEKLDSYRGVDSLTGATITSRAVVNALQEAAVGLKSTLE